MATELKYVRIPRPEEYGRYCEFGDYDILLDPSQNSLLFQRKKEYQFPILADRKMLSLQRKDIISIELTEEADWTKASIIGMTTGIAMGITGSYLGYNYLFDPNYLKAKTAAMGVANYCLGFASGFTYSLHRYRTSSLNIDTKQDKCHKFKAPFNINTIKEQMENVTKLSELWYM